MSRMNTTEANARDPMHHPMGNLNDAAYAALRFALATNHPLAPQLRDLAHATDELKDALK